MATHTTPTAKPRPIWFNLNLANQPLPAILSILHRISGALLFLFGIPILLWAVQRSLAPEGLASLRALFGNPLVKLVLLGFLWAYLHHLFAGIRFLLLDMHKGVALAPARRSARVSIALALVLTVIIGVRLW
jgi:succinate dehydrogenase / fumarate reductase cytochrome b subunit